MSRWSAIRQGFVDTIVVWPGVAPFGMVYAVSALAAGLSIWETLGMSLIVFAGVVRWLVKHYLYELRPNGGSSLKDKVNSLEEKVELLTELVKEALRK